MLDPSILPVFPLSTVLVPGLVMPLHIFEQRYRDLVADLLARDEDERRFVVVAIKEGHEVGGDATPSLFEIGTIAEVREVTPLDDGRYDLVTVGTTRVALGELVHDRSYLQANVEPVPEAAGDEAPALLPRVAGAFATYRGLLTDSDPDVDDLPDDPGVLSYLIAAAMVMDLADRQRLLSIPDDSERLRVELHRLRHEIAVMRVLPSLPAVDLLSSQPSSN